MSTTEVFSADRASHTAQDSEHPLDTSDTTENIWLDDSSEFSPEEKTSLQNFYAGSIDPALRAPKEFLDWFKTSPGHMTLIALSLVIVILASGLAMASSVSTQREDIQTLQTKISPLSDATQDLFTSLAEADQAANTVYIQSTQRSVDVKQNYEAAITEATRAMVQASMDLPENDEQKLEYLLTIQQNLPTYVSLLSAANTNNDLGFPVGASYLKQAGELMHTELLPAAQALYNSSNTEVNQQQQELYQPHWLPLAGLAAAILFLVIAQVWLGMHTNRVLNKGFLAATIIMVFAFLWAVGASVIAWHDGARNNELITEPLGIMSNTRIETQQTRAEEVFNVANREYSSDARTEFSKSITDADDSLSTVRKNISHKDVLDDAREQLRQWDSAHGAAIKAMENSDYTTGVGITTDPKNTPSSTNAFSHFDENLDTLISSTRTDQQDYFNDSQHMAQKLSIFIVILTIIAAVCIAFGVRGRIQEYL